MGISDLTAQYLYDGDVPDIELVTVVHYYLYVSSLPYDAFVLLLLEFILILESCMVVAACLQSVTHIITLCLCD